MLRIHAKYLAQLVLAACVSSAHAGAYEDFFRAVGTDNVSTVRQLLQRGFDPNSVSEQGQTGLYLALKEGNDKVIEALLSAPGLTVDLANAAGETALMMAALRGQLPWIQRLLDMGAQVDRPGWTALHYAASGPDSRAVKMLLDRGAKPNAPSPNGTTPLMMAARYGSEPSVDILLAGGADARLRSQLGLSAADFAQQAGRAPLAERLAALLR